MGETFWEHFLGVRTFVESTEIPGRREKSSQYRRFVHKRENKGVKMSTIENLLREGLSLKMEIETRQQKLREINKDIAEQAEFKPGSSTGHIAAGGIMAKVTKRQNVRWDQDALAVAHKQMGTELFAKAFTYKFEPINARQLKNWLASGDVPDEAKHLVLEARTVTEGAPSVVYEEAGDAD